MRQHCSRVIIENFFEPSILYLLLEKPSYGYELKSNLAKRCACQVNIANLYRGLARLQKEGHITKKTSESKVGPDRNTYKITAKGKKLLKEWVIELEEGVKTIQKLINNFHNYETSQRTKLR